jgi:hypothetical protein
MSFERIVDVALRAYPSAVREACGAEMRDTALEVAGRSRRLLLREGVALLGGGMKARAGVAASLAGRRLTVDICAQAASIWGLATLASWAALDRMLYEWSFPGGGLTAVGFVVQGLMAMSVVLVLVGCDRAAGSVGVLWIVISLVALLVCRLVGVSPCPICLLRGHDRRTA